MSLVPIRYADYPHDLYNLHKQNKIGNWELKKVTMPKGHQEGFYQDGKMCRCIFIEPYKLIKLRHNGDDSFDESLWMSDTPFEYETTREAIEQASGDVLECGLGIGMFTYYVSKKDIVKSLTIVEKQNTVIKLVYDKIRNKKTSIINDDVFHYLRVTPRKFDMIHIDIWAGTIEPYFEMQKIIRLAKKKLKPNGIIKCWLSEILKTVKSELKKGKRLPQGFGIYDPCLTCGKILRYDYKGFCMDCADGLGISELGMRI